MSRSTSKKKGKNGNNNNNNKGTQSKATNKPVVEPEQKVNANQATVDQPKDKQSAPATNNKQAEKAPTKNDSKQNSSKTAEKSVTDKKPLSNKDPLANQEPSASKKPSANQKPLASKEPSVSKEPSASKESSANQKPSASKDASTNKKPLANNKEPLANKEPSVHKESSMDKNSQYTGTETVQTTTNQQSSGKKGSGLSFFAILLSLLALGFSGYQWYSSQVNSTNANTQFAIDISKIGNQVGRINDTVARLKTDQSNIQSDIVTQSQLDNKIIKASSSFDKQVRDLEQAQSGLTESVTTINEELRKGANQYVLDEVSQLLRLGNNSAIFMNNAESAVNAFTLADIQLKELNNPRYSAVRRKINDEIQLLKSIEQVDSESILAQLNLITNNVSSLPLENKLPTGEKVTLINTSANNNNSAAWQSELKEIFSDIINSVSIEKIDQAPQELLAPRERYLLDQNLKLQLVKAEIALLQNNQQLYNNSISEASKWVRDYFDPKDDLVKKTLSQLASLKNEKLNVQLPGVSGSYDLLQTIKGGQ